MIQFIPLIETSDQCSKVHHLHSYIWHRIMTQCCAAYFIEGSRHHHHTFDCRLVFHHQSRKNHHR
jgi:hypothetical protein